MKLLFLLGFLLLVTASPFDAREPAAQAAACSKASCYVAVQNQQTISGHVAATDCSSFLQITATPCPVTTTVTVNGPTKTVTSTTTLGQPVLRALKDELFKRAACTKPVISRPTSIPSYDTSSCNVAQFSAACACLGITATTTTVSPPTSTVSSTQTFTVTTVKTITPCVPTTTTKTLTSTQTVSVATTTRTVRSTQTNFATSTIIVTTNPVVISTQTVTSGDTVTSYADTVTATTTTISTETDTSYATTTSTSTVTVGSSTSTVISAANKRDATAAPILAARATKCTTATITTVVATTKTVSVATTTTLTVTVSKPTTVSSTLTGNTITLVPSTTVQPSTTVTPTVTDTETDTTTTYTTQTSTVTVFTTLTAGAPSCTVPAGYIGPPSACTNLSTCNTTVHCVPAYTQQDCQNACYADRACYQALLVPRGGGCYLYDECCYEGPGSCDTPPTPTPITCSDGSTCQPTGNCQIVGYQQQCANICNADPNCISYNYIPATICQITDGCCPS